ncbi:MAG: hypothetical protein V4557_08280 [Bacteroidota bacterium]
MKKTAPYDFLLDHLPANIIIQPAIGMFYIYFDKKIILIFRKVNKNPQHNGIWIAAKKEDHGSLKAEIPAIDSFLFDGGESFDMNWLLLSDSHDDFESAGILLCDLISKKDQRIGKRTPKSISL